MDIKYYKQIINGYLISIGTINGANSAPYTEVTEEEFNSLYELISSAPSAPDGYYYRITEDGEYELTQNTTIEIEEDPTEFDYAMAGHIFFGD